MKTVERVIVEWRHVERFAHDYENAQRNMKGKHQKNCLLVSIELCVYLKSELFLPELGGWGKMAVRESEMEKPKIEKKEFSDIKASNEKIDYEKNEDEEANAWNQ